MEVKNKALKSKYPEFASNMKQKGINKLLFPLKLSENNRFFDDVNGK